ncbi:DsbA family protein [Hymenobacter cellulosilyticus]|uniref:DsbA family protein n=1 Tax=Hymenobacter cellulosilyticus TaxID=2932248 RepID=A0A8T9Q5F0_9BACT|nr:DsbA family protein [Hymenobacter cellulosilyticus]UOQ72192.1 DsbA family protein [Hymenobacter cellulosilyticus]
MEQTPDLPELLYIFDPLCGWCYGMSPVVEQIQNEFQGRLTVSVLSGGMVTGLNVGSIRQDWEYISAALEQVEKVAGVQFGQAFRELGAEGSRVQDSEPPSRALTVFRQLDPYNQTASFAHALQQAYFGEGKDLNDPDTYAVLAADFGLNVAEFQRRWALPETAQATRQEFAAVGRIGVQGFPTTILRVGNQGYLLARGFMPYDAFASSIEQALQQAAEEGAK